MSLRSKLWTKIATWFQPEIVQHTQKHVDRQISVMQQEQSIRSIRKEYLELEQYIGKPIIAISNEIDNLIIGYGTNITKFSTLDRTVLEVYDYVSDRSTIVTGKVIHYHPAVLDWLYEADPRLVIYLLYGSSSRLEDNIDDKLYNMLSMIELKNLLHTNGFYEAGNRHVRRPN